MEKVLVTTDEYNGRYVAMKSFDDSTVVGVGDDPEKALKDAEVKGFKDPVVLYIPEEDVVHIYPLRKLHHSGRRCYGQIFESSLRKGG
ncbi:MAG: DUF5678 domain-containing protein [Syntrophales bacterium]|nr:DUF5678 domain-containing protein [Syntrophales bacterium]